LKSFDVQVRRSRSAWQCKYDVAVSHAPRTGRHASQYPLARIALLPAVIVSKLKSTSILTTVEVKATVLDVLLNILPWVILLVDVALVTLA
jgi:hypothetical protein